MKKIGITGGVGSGKSTIARVFGLYGVPIYDSDTEAKALMNTDPDVKSKLSDLLGDSIYVDGKLDRALMSQKIFAEPVLRSQVESIVHPAVQARARKWQDAQAEAGVPYSLQEAALLIQSGTYRTLDQLIVVLSPRDLRISRLEHSRGYTVTKSEKIMSAQMSDEEMETYADFKIFNNERQSIILQVSDIHQSILQN